MRIVYDHTAFGPNASSAPSSSGTRGNGRGESVLVISARKVASDGAAGGAGGELSLKGAAYEVRISDEALARDREVRAHEGAHLAVLGGAAASPVMYDIRTGPGGEKIATGAKIAVDLAEVPGDPAATLRKARTVIAAANAPGDPSAADMRTAARAYSLARQARSELARISHSGIALRSRNDRS